MDIATNAQAPAVAKKTDFDVHLKEGKLVVKGSFNAEDGGASVEAWYDAKKLIEKAVDALEEKIPGDQKALAATFKAIIAGIEF